MAGDSNYANVSLHLPFNGPADARSHFDRAPTQKTLTNSVGTALNATQSKYNSTSLYLNGVNDTISAASHADFNFGTGDFTIELWVYGTRTNQPHSSPRILANGAYLAANAWNLVLIASSGALFFDTYNGSAVNGSSIGTLVENSWNHIAVTRQSGTLRTFLNGALVTTKTDNQSLSGAYTTYVGSDTISFFKGYIDDLRITKGVARYTGNFTPVENQIGGLDIGDPFYSSTSLLVNADTTTLADQSPVVKTITKVGNAGVSFLNSKAGLGSIYFDGTGDYLTIPDSSAFDLGTGDFTLECWYYPLSVSGAAGFRGLISQRTNANVDHAFSLFVNQNNAGFGFAFTLDGSTNNEQYFGSALTVNTWYHVAVSRVEANLYFAVNGAVTAATGSASAVFNSSQPVQIGRLGTYTGGDLHGYLDSVRVTKGVARYTAAFTPPNYSLSNYIVSSWQATQGSISLIGQIPVFESYTPFLPVQGSVALTGQTAEYNTGYVASQGTVLVSGQIPVLPTNIFVSQGSLLIAGQIPELFFGTVAAQGSIAVSGQNPAVSTGFFAQQRDVGLSGQTPFLVTTISGETAEVAGRGFQTLPTILGDYDVSVVTGGTFGTVSKIYGGALVVGSPFKATPALTALADQTGYVAGRGFLSTPTIEIAHDFVSSVQGRGFSSKSTVVGGSIVAGRAFSSPLTATIDAPISLSVTGQGFQTRPTIVAEYQPAMRITGRGFVSGIGYSTVTGRGFTQNAVLKALETSNFAEAFVFNMVPANVEQNLYSVSRYQNYPFQHLTRIANEYYGVKADGLYRLTGGYDAAEDVPVNGTIKLNEDDLSAFNSQNIPYIYLNGDDDYAATAFVDDIEQPAFSSGFNGRRVKLARGSKGRYWYFKIEGIKSLLGVEYRPEKLARKVK